MIFEHETVNVFIGAGFADFHHPALNLEVAVGVGRVGDAQGNARVAAHVAVFDPSFGRVDEDVIAVGVEPDRRHLRRAVAVERGEIDEGLGLVGE